MDADEAGLPPLAGRVLAGRYLVEALIGRGGMAAVYRGRDQLLTRPVALKVLVGPLAHDPDASMRFRAEARAAAAVSDPNVVAVYDVGEDGDQAFIVMELVPGESLAARLRRGPLEVADAVRLGADLLSGLEAAHRSGLLHRDIKPGNVILTLDGVAKLADFGIAKAVRSVSSATQPLSDPGVVLGTLSYLAPERLRGEPATVRSDLWSVGAVLYEAVTGRVPFGLDRLSGESGAAMDVPEHPVLAARPDTGPELAGAIERAMAPQPEQRFESAAEMRAALLGTEQPTAPLAVAPVEATGEPTTLLPVAGVREAPRPPEREGRAWLLLPLALVVALVVGLGALWLSSRGSPARPPSGSTTTLAHAAHGTTTTTSSTTTTTSTSTTSTTSSTTTVPATTTSSTPTTTTSTTSTIPVTTSSIPVTTTTVLPTTTTSAGTTTTSLALGNGQ